MPRKSTDSPMMKVAKKIAKLLVDSGLPVAEQKGAMLMAGTMLFYKAQEPKEVSGGK